VLPSNSKPYNTRGTGHAVNFRLDEDAYQLLKAMAPGTRGIGDLLSELIRREASWRSERPALLQALAAGLGDEPRT